MGALGSRSPRGACGHAVLCGWRTDGQTVWRLQDGQQMEAISLEEAARIAARVGEPVPHV